ncbi:hypothetical protein SETIT_2G143300v2 [Setaria italica]|uniref:WIYLD domain-containing protein n=1 Tax=Setaria italica TaxID=4555 RepID=K3ZWZ7_SETIT|nr:uncharacterized protein LOC101762506 [Setaria italica]RCV10870.1 hypothetical protein SETIT_2G143300v2 [Setaria italica]
MPAPRGRGRSRGRGDRRIDAAIDHFAAMGYAARDIRDAIADLLKVYGGPSAWPLLEEGSYQVVQDKLFEKEDEEKQKQEQEQEQDQTLLLEGQQVEEEEEEPPQHQEPAVDEAPPENNKLILLHDEVPVETESADEVEDPMFIEPSPLEAIVPLTAAVGIGCKRKPCYGWLTESDDEEQPTIQHHEVHIPTSGGGLLCKRNQVQ